MRALGPTRLDRQPVRVVEEAVRISLWGVLAAWLARKLWRLLVAILRSPSTQGILIVAIFAVVVGRRFGPVPLLIAAGIVVVVLVGWRLRWPAGFQRWVRWPVRAWWRTGLIYRWRWSKAMTGADLGRKRHDTEYLPQLLRVRSTRSVDRVRVRMLPGHTLDDYAAVADRLGQTFGTFDCRIRSVPRRVHELELWLLIADPLDHIVDPFDAEPEPLTAGLPVALAEDGSIWRLQLLGTHVLVVGATGAGKGSVIWSILTALSRPDRGRVGEGVGGRPERRHGTRPWAAICSTGSATATTAPTKPPMRSASRSCSRTPSR